MGESDADGLPKVAVGVVLENERVLVARRILGLPGAGLWEFPGGKVEAGETVEAALVRELMEETSLDVEIIKLLLRKQTERWDLHFFLCNAIDPNALQSREGYDWQWLTCEEVGDLEMFASNWEVQRMVAKGDLLD